MSKWVRLKIRKPTTPFLFFKEIVDVQKKQSYGFSIQTTRETTQPTKIRKKNGGKFVTQGGDVHALDRLLKDFKQWGVGEQLLGGRKG